MAASNLRVTEAGVPTHHIRNEKTGTDGTTGKDILAQVVLAGVHKRTYLGVQSLTLTGSAQTLTVPAGTPATFADIYCEGGGATDFGRYWHGGVTPTAAVGKRLYNDQELQSADPGSFSAIVGSGTPILRVEYYSNG